MRKLLSIAVSLLICCGLVGCNGEAVEKPAEKAQAVDTADSVSALSDRQQQLWSNNCALCHVAGEGGAPRIAISEDWVERKAKGRDVLLKHTIEGFNNMPPLGYCMACERDDLVALIGFMSGDQL